MINCERARSPLKRPIRPDRIEPALLFDVEAARRNPGPVSQSQRPSQLGRLSRGCNPQCKLRRSDPSVLEILLRFSWHRFDNPCCLFVIGMSPAYFVHCYTPQLAWIRERTGVGRSRLKARSFLLDGNQDSEHCESEPRGDVHGSKFQVSFSDVDGESGREVSLSPRRSSQERWSHIVGGSQGAAIEPR